MATYVLFDKIFKSRSLCLHRLIAFAGIRHYIVRNSGDIGRVGMVRIRLIYEYLNVAIGSPSL